MGHLRSEDYGIGAAAARVVWKICGDMVMCKKLLEIRERGREWGVRETGQRSS